MAAAHLSSCLLIVLLACAVQCNFVRTQETKGGFINSQLLTSQQRVRGASSSFKGAPIVETTSNSLKESSFSSSSSSTIQRPAILNSQQQQEQRQTIVEEQQRQNSIVAQSEPSQYSYGGVSGTPGVDFPSYASIPNTGFKCDNLPFNPGMYADESTGCQVYHLCYQGRRESFLCGAGTVFNQAIMNCDFWHSVDCTKSAQYYHLNADFGKSLGEPTASLQRPRVSLSSKQRTTISETSSSFVQPPPPPPRQEISSFLTTTNTVVRQQQSGGIKSSGQLVNRPALINTVLATGEFSATRLSSARLNEPASSSSSSTATGKTSLRREKLGEARSAAGFLSPARQLQLNKGQLYDSSTGPMTMESSTRFKVMSGAGITLKGNQGGASSLSVGSSLAVADNSGAAKLAVGEQQATLEKPSGGAKKTSQLAATEQASFSTITKGGSGADDNNTWKPYFKSKHNSKVGSAKSTTVSASTSPQASTSSTTSAQPAAEPVTISRPNQEPVFSRTRDEDVLKANQMTTTTTTAATPTDPTEPASEAPPGGASIEPDVGAALAVTEAPSGGGGASPTTLPATTTTTISADRAEPEAPAKSDPPPPTEEPSVVAGDDTGSSPTTSSPAESATSREPAGSSTGSGAEAGRTRPMEVDEQGRTPATTTTTTTTRSPSSSVEYATTGGSAGGADDSEAKEAGEQEAKAAAARKRTAT